MTSSYRVYVQSSAGPLLYVDTFNSPALALYEAGYQYKQPDTSGVVILEVAHVSHTRNLNPKVLGIFATIGVLSSDAEAWVLRQVGRASNAAGVD